MNMTVRPIPIVVASITASIFDEFYFPDFHKYSKMDYMADIK